MPLSPAVSYPSSSEEGVALRPRSRARLTTALRLALVGWAAVVYLVYWLGYLPR